MATYTVTFATTIELTVTVEAADEDQAADLAWNRADEYLKTVAGNYRDVSASALLDGVGADEVVPA